MKNVNVIINSMHKGDSGEDSIQVNTEGTYYYKNGKHYICYKETDRESGEVSNSLLKIWGNIVEMVKRGTGATRLYFEAGRLNNTCINTIMGNISVSIDTKNLKITEETEKLKVIIEYCLIMGGEKISECRVEVLVDGIK